MMTIGPTKSMNLMLLPVLDELDNKKTESGKFLNFRAINKMDKSLMRP